MNREDYDLLQKLCEGDISALEILYIRYAPQIKSFVSAILKNPIDTEDIVQDIFLKIWDERKTVCRAKSLKAYLFSMTRNITYNHLKKQQIHHRFLNFSNHNSSSYNLEQRITSKDLLKHISNEMTKFPERQRTVFEKNRNNDLSYKEISEELGISTKTVQYHISSVLSKLRKMTN